MSEKAETKITFEGMRYKKRDDESVLDALLRGGANVSFSCRKGSCHVCLLQATEGVPGADAQRGLQDDMRRAGLFMPCVTTDCQSLTVRRPDPSCWTSDALVQHKREVRAGVFELSLEVGLDVTWRAGQFVNLLGPDGVFRSYSISSVREEDYFLELLVKHWPDGKVSGWVAQTLDVGSEVKFQGPFGACFYDEAMIHRPLLLVGTGTGISPLIGIVREALRAGHSQSIQLYHGAHDALGLFWSDRLHALAAEHANFHYVPCVSGAGLAEGVRSGRASDVAFDEHRELSAHVVFLCGNPDAVDQARVRAVAAGAERARIHADPFEDDSPKPPRDKEILNALEPDDEMWQALGKGRKLRVLLEDFYTRVYDDPRLAPFFHRVTKERAIQKQYEFLRDVFTGARDFFGARPFNAHHWMVISDELFDYREELFVASLRRHGIAEHLVRRWSAMHERFRRDIVKSAPRGLVVGGEETVLEGYTLETLAVGALCDGCQAEMLPGSTGRMHQRTGELFCTTCTARVVGASQIPVGSAEPSLSAADPQ